MNRSGYIYFVMADNGLVKIGRTKNIERRMDELTFTSPIGMTLLSYFATTDYIKAEMRMHHKYRAKRKHGEWFALDVKDIEKIIKYK